MASESKAPPENVAIRYIHLSSAHAKGGGGREGRREDRDEIMNVLMFSKVLHQKVHLAA